jgi:hypothetical protein
MPMPIHLSNYLLIRLSDLAYLDNPISAHPPMRASRTSERFGVRCAAATVGVQPTRKHRTALHCSAAVKSPPQRATLPAADHSTERGGSRKGVAHTYFNRSVVDVFQLRNVLRRLALEAPVCGRYNHMQGIASLRQTKRHRARVVQRA